MANITLDELFPSAEAATALMPSPVGPMAQGQKKTLDDLFPEQQEPQAFEMPQPAGPPQPTAADTALQDYLDGLDQTHQFLQAQMPHAGLYLDSQEGKAVQQQYAQQKTDFKTLQQQDSQLQDVVGQWLRIGQDKKDPQGFSDLLHAAADARRQLVDHVHDAAGKGSALLDKAGIELRQALDDAQKQIAAAEHEAGVYGAGGPDPAQKAIAVSKMTQAMLAAQEAKDNSPESLRKIESAIRATQNVARMYHEATTKGTLERGDDLNPDAANLLRQQAQGEAKQQGAGGVTARNAYEAFRTPGRPFRNALGLESDQAGMDEASQIERQAQQGQIGLDVGGLVGNAANAVGILSLGLGGAGKGISEALAPAGAGALRQAAAGAVGRGASGVAFNVPQTVMSAVEQGRAPTGREIGTSVAAGLIAPQLSHAFGEAAATVAGKFPELQQAMVNELTPASRGMLRLGGGAVNSGASMVATNYGLATAQGEHYDSAQAIRDFAVGVGMHLAMAGPDEIYRVANEVDAIRQTKDYRTSKDSGNEPTFVGRKGAARTWADYVKQEMGATTAQNRTETIARVAREVADAATWIQKQHALENPNPSEARASGVVPDQSHIDPFSEPTPIDPNAKRLPGTVETPTPAPSARGTQLPGLSPKQLQAFQERVTRVESGIDNIPAGEDVDTHAFNAMQKHQRAQRLATYTPESLATLDTAGIQRAAQDLGVHFDAPTTTIPRILDALENRKFEGMTDQDLYRQAKAIIDDNAIPGVKAGGRAKNIAIIRAWNETAQEASNAPSQAQAETLRNPAQERPVANGENVGGPLQVVDRGVSDLVEPQGPSAGDQPGNVGPIAQGESNAQETPAVTEPAVSTPAPAAAPEVKEPWQLTRRNFGFDKIKSSIHSRGNTVVTLNNGTVYTMKGRIHAADAIVAVHRAAVRDALTEGKPVPPEVLAEFPDLVPAETSAPAKAEPEDGSRDTTPASLDDQITAVRDKLDAAERKAMRENGGRRELAKQDPKVVKLKKQFDDLMAKREGQETPSEPAPETPEQPTQTSAMTPHEALADELAGRLAKGERLTSMSLTEAANRHFGGSIGQGKYDIKDAYDALELAVNKYIASKPGEFNPGTPLLAEAQMAATELAKLKDGLPTQTRRTGESQSFQQFSTPPDFAFAVNWIANIAPDDTMLEPSAGVGGIAVFGKNAGADVHVNELAPRRAEMLKALGFPKVTVENAEQISNILNVKPTVVVMNPPFSQTAGRMGDKKMLGVAGDHIEQAFKLLADGGRLVAIVGEGMKPGAPKYADFFKKMQPYLVANVGVSGDVYKKYGTTFGTRVLVFDKTADQNRTVITGDVPDVLQLMNLLKGVRDARDTATELPAREPVSQGETAGSRPVGVAEPGETVPVATGSVGAGAQPRSRKGGRQGAVSPGSDRGGSAATATGDGAKEPVPGTDSGARTGGGDSAPAGGQGGGAGTGDTGAGEEPRLTVTSEPESTNREALTEAVFENYKPQRVRIAGSQPHPTSLVESAAMASVTPPMPKYSPKIPQAVIDNGHLSDAQLENIVYAGQAHEQLLPDGTRRGYFIGDGTGVGKGAQIAGIILDNYNRGRKKALWISENFKLFEDAKRDWSWVGGTADKMLSQNKVKAGEKIEASDGVMFTGYGTLRTDPDGPKSRLKQLIDWLGKDFDGVIAFDEAHNMKNSLPVKGARGQTETSETAAVAAELQKQLPNARVVYVSATGATEVANLAYASRLGLWGEGTAFPDARTFVNEIQAGGVAAMELVARDAKQLGSYMARNLSFQGVEYNRLEHTLTKDQIENYNALADAWSMVLNNIDKALEMVAKKSTGAIDGKAKSAAYSAFWGSNQRFFNQIITAMQMPSVIADIEKQLDDGKSVVLQLTNTNEASMERSLAKLQAEDDSLENLDLTPRDQLMQFVEHSFPVQQYESYVDDSGKERMRMVRDADGNPVINREAVALRENLLNMLGSVKVGDGPLEFLMNHFGVEQVAENTGRSRRVVKIEEKGQEKTVVQNRSKGAVLADVAAFNAGKKRILVFSQAGGTGASYHADKRIANQQARVHYLVQAGWVADKAVQGLGRTHRSNQVHTPFYRLVTTDLPGQKRFISSIARRMDQLGAITKGQRQAASQGIFKETDNLESQYAKDSLREFFKAVHRQDVPGLSIGQLEHDTGLRLLDENGQLRNELPPIQQFLNRILSLRKAMQHTVFDAYSQILETTVGNAKANGTFDAGVETIQAHKIEKVNEQTVFTEPRSGAKTKMVELNIVQKTKPLPFDRLNEKGLHGKPLFAMVVNKRSGHIYALAEGGTRTTDSGRTIETVRQYSPNGKWQSMPKEQYSPDNYELVRDREDQKRQWDEAVAKVPKTTEEPLHLITGAVLPIWDRLRGQPKVFRMQTSDGERLLGRVVPEEDVATTLKNLGIGDGVPKWTPDQTMDKVLNGNMRLTLANDWQIKRSRVGGEYRLELLGPDFNDARILERHGVFMERIQFQTRYFIPTDSSDALAKVLEYHPISDVEKGGNAPSLSRATDDKMPPEGADDGQPDAETGIQGPAADGEGQDSALAEHGGSGRATGEAFSSDDARRIEEVRTRFLKHPDISKRIADVRFSEPVSPAHQEAAALAKTKGFTQVRIMDATAKPGQTNPVFAFIDPMHPDILVIDRQTPDAKLADKVLHETVHFLRETGDPLYQQMVDAVAPNPMARHGIIQRFGKAAPAYLSDSVGRRFEEAIAHAIEWTVSHRRPEWLTTPQWEALAPAFQDLMKRNVAASDMATSEDETSAMSRGNAPTFFLKSERIIGEKMGGSAAPLQVRGMLENNGVKPDEMKWTGLDDFLRDHKGPVSKQEVLDFLRANNVQIQEVMKGENIPANWVQVNEDGAWTDGYSVLTKDLSGGGYSVITRDKGVRGAPNLEAAKRLAESLRPSHDSTKFSNWQLPGGTDYRELLLTLPPKDRDTLPAGYTIKDTPGKVVSRFEVFGPGEGRYASGGTKAEAIANFYRLHGGDIFKSSHFDEPNILAHVRFNSRIDAEGRRVLFLEEVQSDWHQKGREKGYRDPVSEAADAKEKEDIKEGIEYQTARLGGLNRDFRYQMTRQQERMGMAENESTGERTIFGQMRSVMNAREGYMVEALQEQGEFLKEKWGKMAAEHDQATRRLGELYAKLDKIKAATKGVPDAPFKKTWHEMALRRMLRYAAENGYDSLAWTTGEQQAERYDLSKQISRIEYEPINDPPNTYELIAYDLHNDEVVREEEITIDRVSDLVGKELAKKIENREGEKKDSAYRNWHVLSGFDLKVGGEGMKGFYDKIIPDYLNKYGKRWGAKVGETQLAVNKGDPVDDGAGGLVQTKAGKVGVHSLPITDAMRESVVNEGQPLFSKNQGPQMTPLYSGVPIPQFIMDAATDFTGKLVNFVSGEMAQSVNNTPAGKGLIRGLDEAASYEASLAGQVANDDHRATKALSHADKKWMMDHDAEGYSNIQKALEDTPSGPVTVPSPEIKQWVDVYNKMKSITGHEAERVKLPLQGGGTFHMAKSGRFLRQFTGEALEALHNGSGPLYAAIQKAIMKNNPGVTKAMAKDMLEAMRSPDPIKHVSVLEKLRTIKNLPSYVQMPGGEWVSVLETDPTTMITRSARAMARRIGFFEQVGSDEHVAKLRAKHVESGGKERPFDNVIAVYNRRPFGRVGGDPRSAGRRLLKVADSMIVSAQTSLSAIPNLPQTAVQVPRYAGAANFVRAIGTTLMHLQATADDLAAVGAINHSIMDWTLHEGRKLEDVASLASGVVSRVTLTHWIAQFNNMVAGTAMKFRADQWAKGGIPASQQRLAKELRLTPAEIAAVNAGRMSWQTRNKIIQNGIKLTQYVTEDPHRKSQFQNIPLLRSLFDYQNYAIGSGKSSVRAAGDIVDAIRSKSPIKLRGAMIRSFYLLAGAVGASLASLMMRRAIYQQDMVQEGENAENLIGKALWDAQMMGPVQRMVDASNYGNTIEQQAIRLSPKLKFYFDAIGTMVKLLHASKEPKAKGKNTKEQPTTAQLVDQFFSRNVPIYRASERAIGHNPYPEKPTPRKKKQ